MMPDSNCLANQMDRLIVLADTAWRLAPEPCGHLAHTLYLVGKMYQAAASARRAEEQWLHPTCLAGGVQPYPPVVRRWG